MAYREKPEKHLGISADDPGKLSRCPAGVAVLRGRSHIAGSWLPSPKPDLERQLDEARAKISALEAELREADRLNRKLTARLLVDGVGDNTAASSTGKASDGHG